MTPLGWIVLTGSAMSAIALVGSITLLMKRATLDGIIMPLVAFAAGSLLRGAFFHMLPAASESIADSAWVYLWTPAGFTVFFAVEQFLHWHHCHRAASDCKEPLTYLILIGDGLHNFLGSLGVGGVTTVAAEAIEAGGATAIAFARGGGGLGRGRGLRGRARHGSPVVRRG